MPIVTIQTNNLRTTSEAAYGELLQNVLHSAGVLIPAPCGGNHTCGKCLVYASGVLSEPDEREQKFLAGKQAGLRLSCFAEVLGDCNITLPEDGAQNIITRFDAEGIHLDPIYDGEFGAAFDIGTTTIAGYLFSRDQSEPNSICGEINEQQGFGADVMTRIAYANEHTEKALSGTIRNQLGRLLVGLCESAAIAVQQVSALVITGNTTMLHLLTELPVRSLAIAPFHTESLFGAWHMLELGAAGYCRAYLPHCISAYVGADITCGILASGLMDRKDTTFFVDVGTNGEMVLQKDGSLVCCSTAAGPAFEGAGISAGSCAIAGAINRVWVEENKIHYTTLENIEAKSICGSGLIEAVASGLQTGLIDRNGRIVQNADSGYSIADSGITLTQSDIRQLQLAKGAIRAGMDSLMHEYHAAYDELSQVILCGGFGSYLDPVASGEIGLIDPGCVDRTVAIGNAAGKGASMILQSKQSLEQSRRIAKMTKTVELSTSKYFMKRFIQMMRF